MKQKKTVENYVKTIYILRKTKGTVRGTDIAEKLKVSRSTVSVALKGLEKEGYLSIDEGHEIRLTQTGQQLAEVIYERYQTFQNLLEDLGVDKETAGQDACQMEHAVSAESYRALKFLTQRHKSKG